MRFAFPSLAHYTRTDVEPIDVNLSHGEPMTDLEIRSLVYRALRGHCPFCDADLTVKSPQLRAVERGLRGTDFRVYVENQRALLCGQGIDPDTYHRVECERPK